MSLLKWFCNTKRKEGSRSKSVFLPVNSPIAAHVVNGEPSAKRQINVPVFNLNNHIVKPVLHVNCVIRSLVTVSVLNTQAGHVFLFTFDSDHRLRLEVQITSRRHPELVQT